MSAKCHSNLTDVYVCRHQAREAEPRDYDMSLDCERDLTRSTYCRIADHPGGEQIPPTTYQSMNDQLKLKNDFTERDVTKHMINEDTFECVDLDRCVSVAYVTVNLLNCLVYIFINDWF